MSQEKVVSTVEPQDIEAMREILGRLIDSPISAGAGIRIEVDGIVYEFKEQQGGYFAVIKISE